MSAGFSGFSIAKKPVAKPTGKSNLATSSLATSKATSLEPIDKHEELRRVTEAAKIEIQKDDIKAMTAALEEDPTLFDYSDYYDEMQSKMQTKKKPTGNAKYGYGITISKSADPQASAANTSQSRYIDGLLSKARERESEREMILERQRHKENQKYEETFGSTESFVTPEYQAKLEQDEQKRRELDQRDRQETESSSMANFYTNLRRETVGGLSTSPSAPGPTSPSFSGSQSDDTPSRSNQTVEKGTDEAHQTALETEQDFPFDSSLSRIPSQPRQSLIAHTTRKPRRHTDDMIEAAKQRYQLRKEQRTASLQT